MNYREADDFLRPYNERLLRSLVEDVTEHSVFVVGHHEPP
jgi:hypothetical protein